MSDKAKLLADIWRKTHKDYKSVIKGERYVLVLREGGTHLVPLDCLTDDEMERKLS